MFVRYSCGCTGIRLNYSRDIVLLCCDSDRNELGFGYRASLSDKGVEPLSAEAEAKLVRDLDLLIRQGHALRNVAALIGLGHSG